MRDLYFVTAKMALLLGVTHTWPLGYFISLDGGGRGWWYPQAQAQALPPPPPPTEGLYP